MSEFMVHAWISGTLVAILCSFVGFFIVIKSYSFVAHALPQIGFAGGAGAILLNKNPIYGLSIFAVIGALLIGALGKKEHNDVITALILVGGLGFGALFLGLTNKYAAGSYALLFGQILGVSTDQIFSTIVLTIACLICMAFLYRPLLLESISKGIAESRGISVKLIEMLFILTVALVTAAAVPVVGALLCFSLLIEPTAASIYITSNPFKVMILSLIFSVSTVWISLVFAYFLGWPLGFFVSVIGAIIYACSRIIHHFKLASIS
ncbi:MAG TPA: metal ABC transporter permease [Clostridium sp.]|jgi:zinc/manganese transport system permease protein|uniref:Metal ABC transporter permease n=1 Tax=Clostridium lapidicellarium TaxID=3240931 RepID=A0ABV4DWG4_9CLOT|nr:metal ABC transporter permease [Clostridiales bacterium]HBC96582.1 metal ABC transporter permease [Clostridium sp.]